MATAKKLPSGSWRTRVLVGKSEEGKKIYKSFTASTKKESEYLAAEFLMMHKRIESSDKMLFKDAMLNMIELKKPTLSPSTFRNYMQIYNCDYFDSIKDFAIEKLTDKIVQQMINGWIDRDLSPKTIQNLHSMFLSTISTVDKRLIFDTRLPKKYKSDIYIPVDEEVDLLIANSRDTLLELPILLAAYMGLRRSEIVALKWSCVDFKKRKLTINSAAVININNEEIVKKPKSVAGQRTIDIPTPVLEALTRHRNDDAVMVVPLTGAAIFNRFRKLQKKLSMVEFRFHDLRHYNASVMLALGLPDKYAMERIGHSSNAILKNVYQHTMKEKQSEFSEILDDFFVNRKTDDTKDDTKNKKPLY